MIGAITIKAIRQLDGGMDYAASFAGDGDYTTGGTLGVQAALRDAIKTAALAAADRNVRGPEAVTVLDMVAGDCGVYHAAFDLATGALKVRDAAGAEVVAHTDLSGTTFNVLALTH